MLFEAHFDLFKYTGERTVTGPSYRVGVDLPERSLVIHESITNRLLTDAEVSALALDLRTAATTMPYLREYQREGVNEFLATYDVLTGSVGASTEGIDLEAEVSTNDYDDDAEPCEMCGPSIDRLALTIDIVSGAFELSDMYGCSGGANLRSSAGATFEDAVTYIRAHYSHVDEATELATILESINQKEPA